jgi:hypothetical protein
MVCVPPIVTTANDSDRAMMRRSPVTSRDHDIHKGAMDDAGPSTDANAPGLDDDGLPNDETGIASGALSAREDGTQG